MQAVIMAGGKGTRLSPITRDLIPKAMVPFCGKPLIERIVEQLSQNHIRDIVICTGHLGDQITAYFAQNAHPDTRIRFVHEDEPLGTAGALAFAAQYISQDFVFVYGDLVFDIDLERMYDVHRQKEATATLFAHPNSHPFDSDLIRCDQDDRVIGFDFKDEIRHRDYENLVNAGLLLLSPRVLPYVAKPRKMSLEKDLLAALIQSGEAVYAYRSPEYIKDVGTEDRLRIAEEEFTAGKIRAKNLKNRQKAVFLDRDGTVNRYCGLITSSDQLQLSESAAEAIRLLNRSGYLTIIVTNQPVIARGLCSLEELNDIHKRLYTLLGKEGAYVDDLVFCPHHPDKGYPGENAAYKIVCDCRKPKPGMLLDMAAKYNIDLSASWMVGDTARDMLTGRNAGTKTALVKSEATEADAAAQADLCSESLLQAVSAILKE